MVNVIEATNKQGIVINHCPYPYVNREWNTLVCEALTIIGLPPYCRIAITAPGYEHYLTAIIIRRELNLINIVYIS